MQAVHVLVCTVELVLSHFPESLLGPPFYDSHCSHQKISYILLREDIPASSIPPALIITFYPLSLQGRFSQNPLAYIFCCMMTQVGLEGGSKEILLIHCA